VIAQRPDYFITNSQNTAKRINKFYKRDSTVIYPPVNVESLNPKFNVIKDNYYLVAGRLVAYKNFEMIVETFNLNGKRLIVAGDGVLRKKLIDKAGTNINFLGYVENEKLIDLYQKAKAFIIATTDEDFGITAIEALASGTPVIAYNGGGSSETIKDSVTGVLYSENTSESLNQAIVKFENNFQIFNTQKLIDESQKYTKSRFIEEIKQFINKKYLLTINESVTQQE